MSLRHWLQLSLTEGIGPVLIARLIDRAGGAEAACDADGSLLRSVEGIGTAKSTHIAASLKRSAEGVDAELARAQQAGVRIICRDDEIYPPMLREIPDPPSILYINGSLEPRDLNSLAIVGSRRCSHYGREQSERFAALLAGAAMTVISGGARGIDSAAHRGAMSHPQGRTIAVLGSGIDVPYPPENANLFKQIAARGAVMSEYPMGTPPLADNFPRRNRIVSGMSRGVLVIEADQRSGALITARQACDDHGRPVFALPGRVDNQLSTGPHKLIRDGAVLVTGIEDIIESIGPVPHSVAEPGLFDAPASRDAEIDASARTPASIPSSPSTESSRFSGLSDTQQSIISKLDHEPADVDTIIERTTLPAGLVMQELTLLSLKGLVKRIDGGFMRRS